MDIFYVYTYMQKWDSILQATVIILLPMNNLYNVHSDIASENRMCSLNWLWTPETKTNNKLFHLYRSIG